MNNESFKGTAHFHLFANCPPVGQLQSALLEIILRITGWPDDQRLWPEEGYLGGRAG